MYGFTVAKTVFYNVLMATGKRTNFIMERFIKAIIISLTN